VVLTPSSLVNPGRIVIPGDISSAAFFIVAALIVPGSRLVLKNVGVNPTRTGLLRVLRRMKASLSYRRKTRAFEPLADLEVCYSRLRGTVVEPQEVPSLIDELPVLMVAAACAQGVTVIQGVRELRVKETDRVASMVDNLSRMGVGIKIMPLRKDEQIEITPPDFLSPGSFRSFGDHRTAMSVCVASCVMKHTSTLDDVSCMNKSFPEFLTVFRGICRK
jgi:3-phosphoshikimate 1-carboxyvinyltransferase